MEGFSSTLVTCLIVELLIAFKLFDWNSDNYPFVSIFFHRKLVKNFTPKKKHEDSEFSLQTGFQRLLTEVNDLAGQHESISEKLSDEVARNVL